MRTLALGILLLCPAFASAQDPIKVSSDAELRAALASAPPGSTIVFGGDITLTAELPSVSADLITIDGAGHTLSGNDQFRGLFVAGFSDGVQQPVSATIQNLTIANTLARGGDGGTGISGGGGGGGLGGGLFVASQASVTLVNVSFSANSAVGGNGGNVDLAADSSGGGGGLGGRGGNASPGAGGGGGGVGVGAQGGTDGTGGAGILTGANFGGVGESVAGGAQGGGGGSSSAGSGGGGESGGGGFSGSAGSGGYGGGGAGGNTSVVSGGTGGFGGGGGGAAGAGGYGGGGGGDQNLILAPVSGAPGGFGGGIGGVFAADAGGGGGAGMGGAIFVDSGGSITVAGALTINGSAVTGGAGGSGAQSGSAYGAGMFFAGFGNVEFASAAGEVQTIADTIGDEFGSSGIGQRGSIFVGKSGDGTLVLSGANTYAGGTQITGGTLSVSSQENLGLGDVGIFGPSRLAITGSGTFDQNIRLANGIPDIDCVFCECAQCALRPQALVTDGPTIAVAAGQTVQLNGQLSDVFPFSPGFGGSLTVTGGGTLRLSNFNTYSGGTTVLGNSELYVAFDGALGDAAGSVTLGDDTTHGTLGLGTFGFFSNRQFTLNAGGGTIESEDVAFTQLNGLITGPGSLTKAGTGTLMLTGNNDYSGGTIVQEGLLQAFSDTALGTGRLHIDAPATVDIDDFSLSVGSLSGAGAFTMAAGTLTLGSDNTSALFSGSITGSGALFKIGSGNQTLTGTNTYDGGTFVSGGTLTGNTNSLQGDIQNDAAVVFDQAGNGTYSGLMSGTGSLTKTGAGILTLGAVNAYTGGTFVLGGTLAGDTTTLFGDIVNNALVQFDQAANGAYAGAMSGTGGLVKNGAGTLTLAGANTFTGTSFINAGTLSTTTANIQGSIVNNAQLVFTQATNGTFAGNINGSGSLTKTGGGTLTLAGSSSYSGGTFITAGTLAGTTSSLQGSVSNGASLLFDQAFSGVFNGAIGGTGSVVKSGTGIVFLNGTNSYTGGTTVNAGGLLGDTSSLQGTIVNNGLVGFVQSGSGTYAGSMSGTGVLGQFGPGTLTLTGNNTYSGGTTISGGGAISIASNNALGAGSGAVTLGDALTSGTLTFTNSGALASSRAFSLGLGGGIFNTTNGLVSISGGISGAGGLTKIGAGTLELGGASSFLGATSVLQGTLRASATNVFNGTQALTLGAGTLVDLNGFAQTVGSIAGDGNIALGAGALTTGSDNTNSLFAGVISGAGSLSKVGSGALFLTGANNYSGGTNVRGGALVGNTTSLQGNILNDALVQFDQNNDGTYAGAMSGSGILAKSGSGVLTLTGANTYSGGTVINGGSLIGTAQSLRGTIINNSSLTFGGSGSGTFTGALGGGGNLVKTGTGTLTLTGNQLGTGLFSINQGTVNLNGSYGGDMTVATGAALRATGSIFGSLNLSGTLFAVPTNTAFNLGERGSSLAATSGDTLEGPSFLSIGRGLTTSTGSVMDFLVGPGATPTILVGGTAALNGTQLNITAPSIGSARSQSFLAMLAENGLSFTNSQVTTNDPTVLPVLRQDRNSLIVTLLNLNIPLESVGGGGSGVGKALDRAKFGATGDAGFIVRELTALNDDQLRDALEQIGGQLHATVLQTAVMEAELISDAVRDQLPQRQLEDVSDVRWWGETGCQRANFDGTNSARGGKANVCMGAGGADRRMGSQWTLGAGGSFTGGNMGLGSFGSGDYKAPRAFGYVGYQPKSLGGFGIRGGGSGSKSKYKTERQIVFAATLPVELGGLPFTEGVNRKAEADQNGTTTDQWSEIHDSRKINTYTIEGLVGIRHARISRSAFVEQGAVSLSLDAAGEILALTQTDVRVHGFRRSGAWRPFFDFNYRRELAEGRTEADMKLSGFPDSEFIVQGINVPTNSYSGKMGVVFHTLFGQGTFTYEFRRAPGQQRQSVGFRVRFK